MSTTFISFHTTDVDFQKYIILKNNYYFNKFETVNKALIDGQEKICDIIRNGKRRTMYCQSGRDDDKEPTE